MMLIHHSLSIKQWKAIAKGIMHGLLFSPSGLGLSSTSALATQTAISCSKTSTMEHLYVTKLCYLNWCTFWNELCNSNCANKIPPVHMYIHLKHPENKLNNFMQSYSDGY